MLNNNIPTSLLAAENRGQISHFWPTVKFRGLMGETTESNLPVRLRTKRRRVGVVIMLYTFLGGTLSVICNVIWGGKGDRNAISALYNLWTTHKEKKSEEANVCTTLYHRTISSVGCANSTQQLSILGRWKYRTWNWRTKYSETWKWEREVAGFPFSHEGVIEMGMDML